MKKIVVKKPPKTKSRLFWNINPVTRVIKKTKKQSYKREYYEFVNLLRHKLKPDTDHGIYPKLSYEGKELGVDFKGYLYDKATTNQLSAPKAYEVYKHFFDLKDNIDHYIEIN